MASIIFSDEAPQDLKQLFTDKETGQYDIAKAQQWCAQVKILKNEEQKKAINSQLIDPMRLNSLYTKYTSMISGSIYIPKWLSKVQDEQKNNFASISYVALPYSSISDSTCLLYTSDAADEEDSVD